MRNPFRVSPFVGECREQTVVSDPRYGVNRRILRKGQESPEVEDPEWVSEPVGTKVRR